MTDVNSSYKDEIVEALIGLQKTANQIPDLDSKITRIKQGVGLLGTRTILDEQFAITASRILAKEPDAAPKDRILFRNGLFFIACLDSLEYILDDDIPIDELSLTFRTPEVLDAEPEDAKVLRDYIFQVPILSVESHIHIQAA